MSHRSVTDQVIMVYAYAIIGLGLIGAIAMAGFSIARIAHIVW